MGMIDSIAESAVILSDVDSTDPDEQVATETVEIVLMDINELRAKHPDLFQVAVEQGVAQERDRVVAHLTMGEASADMTSAIKAVTEGTVMNATMQATYMAASLRRNDVDNRQDDDAAASAADGADETETDEAETVAALVESQLGVSASA